MASSPAIALSWMHPSELHEAQENPREITGERYEALKYSLRQDPSMMEARPIIVDAAEGDVVCGNMRLRACRDLGWEQVPVYLKEFSSPAQRREWMLRDNQEYGNWVPEELARVVAEHERAGSDLRLLGFSVQELTDLRTLGEPDVPPPEDQGDDVIPEVWGIVIDCTSESQQGELLEEFEGRGLKCRALMV